MRSSGVGITICPSFSLWLGNIATIEVAQAGIAKFRASTCLLLPILFRFVLVANFVSCMSLLC